MFALWAEEEDADFWKEAAAASREYLKKACHPETGLAAEYAEYDGSPHKGDYERFGADEWERECADRIQNFFAVNAPDQDYRIYEIDGTPLSEKALHPTAIIATNAQASLAVAGEWAIQHVRQLWETPLREGDRRYYDNCLYLFAFLALSGNYRIW